MDLRLVRMWNLRLLEAKCGGRDVVAKRIDRTVNYVTGLLGENGSFGNKTAKLIESEFKLGATELDQTKYQKWMGLASRYDVTDLSRHAIEDGLSPDELVYPSPSSVEQQINLEIRDTVDNDSGMVYASRATSERNKGRVDVQCYEMWRGDVVSELYGMSVPVSILNEKDLSESQVKSMRMPDDSQKPRYVKGDIIAVNVEWGGELKDDTKYAVWLGSRYTLREVAYQTDGSIFLRCKNSEYLDEHVEKSFIPKLDILGEYVCFSGV